MAITTTKGHVSRALDFYNKDSIYIAIGKSTPWDIEGEPPKPKVSDELSEPILYKRVDSKFLVVPDDSGQITYNKRRWSVVPKEQALEKGARWVYISTYLAFDEVPTDLAYRQIGCITGVKKKPEINESQAALKPSEVLDAGILEVLDNRKPIYREIDKRELLGIIIEF